MRHKFLLVIILFVQLLTSCYYSHPTNNDDWSANNGNGVDSLEFLLGHHYWRNYFFAATDSIKLVAGMSPEKNFYPKDFNSERILKKGDVVGVMDVRMDRREQPAVAWVKVARDQACQGWVKESELLGKSVPDRPISKFIHYFSDRTLLVSIACLVMALLCYLIRGARHKKLQIVHFNDIRSFYPTLLCLTVSLGAVLYGTIQCFAPETWVEYYFNPTLNPLQPELPVILSIFLASVWLMLLVGVAVVDDLLHLPDFSGSFVYLTGLAGVCMILYLFFTLSVHIYIGYPLLLGYWGFAFYRHFKRGTPHYCCGNCGAPISGSGKCPECGAMNEIIEKNNQRENKKS